MVKKNIVLTNPNGFHMRPASVFASAVSKFKSHITIRFNGIDYNGKSLLNIVAACIRCGSDIEIICSGEDENEALEEAVRVIESGLGE